MFGKYFVHELKNTYKLPLIGVLICMFSGLVSGLCINIKSDFLTSAAVLLIFATIIAIVILIFLTISRVYASRLFNSKGYLTLTMPVSTNSILITKTLLVTIYVILYYIGLALTIYLFLQGAFLLSLGDSFKSLASFLKDMVLGFLGIDTSVSFGVNALSFLDRLLSFLALLMVILFGLTIRNIGWKKGLYVIVIIVIIIALVFLYPNITSIDALPSLFYDSTDKVFMFMTQAEVNNMIFDQSTGYYHDVRLIAHFIKYGINLVVAFGGYFISKYFIQNKLDIR